jgi:ribosome-interacting GTPase 1
MLAVAAVPAIAQISQETEQDAESGELDQSFTVTSSGDNSNQCVGIQGVGNTGNSQNVTDILQYGSTADEFEFEEVGSTITVSPTNSTSCDQQVNQAASASG